MSSRRIGSLRLVWLEAFLAVVDHQSYTKAGEALGLKQSTMTRYVAQLEKWLGPPLVASGTTELTTHGERFVPVAKNVVSALHDAREAVRSPHKACTNFGSLKI